MSEEQERQIRVDELREDFNHAVRERDALGHLASNDPRVICAQAEVMRLYRQLAELEPANYPLARLPEQRGSKEGLRLSVVRGDKEPT